MRSFTPQRLDHDISGQGRLASFGHPGMVVSAGSRGHSPGPLGPQEMRRVSFRATPSHQSVQQAHRFALSSASGTRFLELHDESEEEGDKQEMHALDENDEARLDVELKMAQDSLGRLMALVDVSTVLLPDQALGLHIAGVPATCSTAFDIPLSTQVTAIEPHGLLKTCADDPAQLSTDGIALRLASVDGVSGLNGVRHLKLLLQKLHVTAGDRSQGLRVNFVFCREVKFHFCFKNRECEGTALHVATLHKKGQGLLQRLLEEGADPRQEYTFSSRGEPGSAQAIHLAAARGLVRHIDLLLQHGASVHAYSRVNNKDNYSALHEAAAYGLVETAHFLLKCKADPNTPNLKKHTALHVAARAGDVRCCHLLKNFKADLQARNSLGATPVIVAVERGNYRFDKLFHLMERSFEDLLVVSQLCASVASVVMRDNSSHRVHPEWREALVKQATEFPDWATQRWMEIMNNSPGAGEDILDVLTVRPAAQSDTYNPVPRRARLPSNTNMMCRYERTSVWEWDTDIGVPAWQSELCPGVQNGWAKRESAHTSAYEKLAGCCCCRRRQGEPLLTPGISDVAGNSYKSQEASKQLVTELVPVKVRQLKLPGIVNPDVMDILAFTTNHNIVVKPTGQAIIQYAWDHVARYYYWTYVFYQVVIIGSLVVEVVSPPRTLWGDRIRWSLLAVLAHLELFYEFFEMCGFICYLQHGRRRYFSKIENAYNWASIAMLLVVVYMTMGNLTFQDIPIMLSLLVLFRWIQLTWSCRAFEWVGEKILPIMQASFSAHIGGILVVTFCVMFGFLHGSMALELGNALPHHYAAVLGSLKLLLLGDGDGIDVILQLGEAPEEGNVVTFFFLFASMVVFCVCVLNLFIAVHGEAYDSAQDKAFTEFLQERAGICLHCLLRPSWPPRCFSFRVQRRLLSYLLLQLIGLTAWALLLREPSIPTLAPTAMLLVFAMLGDSILVQRPWDKMKGDEYYLWMCYKENFDQGRMLPVERETSESNMDGRIARLKRESTQLYKQLQAEVTTISKNVTERTQSLSQKVQAMDGRLQGLEVSMEELLSNIEYVCQRSQVKAPLID
eukprot:CAMPEP_0181426608 /NCGR_PEP_ID=MMETSP1110-20121109/15749_1 /TAXON_ID=174948 /ORGANISM="Symbiodinium sp., Strain CCMP421" /LENGTH=1071 /DNA_ID=CAMNT_0023549805 /DNA_START=29 /DNA_END=3244 /DNA_ORIENTATION=+